MSNDFLSTLLVGPDPESRLVMLEIFRRAGWRLHEARDRKRALAFLERNPVHVVVANAEFRKWPWKQVFADLQRMSPAPQLVVCSRMADEALWAEVLNWGGHDVLVEPLEPPEVERVVASARRHFDPQFARFPRAQATAAS